MFGRKKKKQDSTGLAGLSNESSVTVTPAAPGMPAPDVPAGPGGPAGPGAPAGPRAPGGPAGPGAPAGPSGTTAPAVTAINLSGVTTGPAALSQILSGQGPIGELIAQIKADPIGFRNRMIAQAQAMGASTYVMAPQGMTPLSAPGASPQHVDVVEELTKAAELHDKGALSDAEFEALKKKLLGE
jgi:hypothetical protein